MASKNCKRAKTPCASQRSHGDVLSNNYKSESRNPQRPKPHQRCQAMLQHVTDLPRLPRRPSLRAATMQNRQGYKTSSFLKIETLWPRKEQARVGTRVVRM
ncbi:hypothetical protein BaRGS_00006782 [Batillaria attramentaria]|uniref:Uncharacterized protein n=1 Tax=Batillaria attramentaria TaxID=370345 RepID=A0ABD0LR70_9CAEN